MNYQEYIEAGLNGKAPLKIIMRGAVETKENEKVGVVSIVYATTDYKLAKEKIDSLIATADSKKEYYVVYSVPLDTDLITLEHFPSIAITKEDLN